MVKQAFKEMYALMERYAEFGASDTEPRAVFAEIMFAHRDGEAVEVPETARGWQLFTDMEGVGWVASMLHDKAIEVRERANEDHRGFIEAMRYYF